MRLLKTTTLIGVIVNLRNKTIPSAQLLNFFLSSKIMAILRNKRKLVAMRRETQESRGNHQLQNSAALGITEDYIAQVSEENEGRVSKKLSQEFSRTDSRILGALSKLDYFLLNPQIRTFSENYSGNIPEH